MLGIKAKRHWHNMKISIANITKYFMFWEIINLKTKGLVRPATKKVLAPKRPKVKLFNFN